MGCYNTCVVPASVEHVWDALRDFHNLSWAKGVVEKVAIVGECAPDQIGAKRVLNDVFHETLLALDDEARSLKYSIDDGPGPVAKNKVKGYTGRIRVFPVTSENHTFVEWSSSWLDSEGGVKEFCDPIYNALLTALVTHFSRGSASATVSTHG